jgi:hypothetical protein
LEIRQSYKKVSRKYHPDKNTAANAEEVFARIKFAYDVSKVALPAGRHARGQMRNSSLILLSGLMVKILQIHM